MSEAGSRSEERGRVEHLEPRASSPDPRLGVLVTRPAHQAGELAQRVEEAGGRPILWPALEIAPADPSALENLPDQLSRADIAIFISPNAVERCAAHIDALPMRLKIGAVGKGTARALKNHFGRETDLLPTERFDSEALLTLPLMLAPKGATVLIIRGAGGREILAETLRARGAKVEYADVYRRACPTRVPMEAYESLARGEISIVTVTSAEGLRNLLNMAGPLAARLLGLPLIVVSERLATSAVELGFKMKPLVAQAASDEAMIEELRGWVARGSEKA